MKFTPNANAIEVLNLNNVRALRFDPQERKRQGRTNLKVRPLNSNVTTTNQTPIRRIENDKGNFVNFRISADMLANIGIANYKKKRYLLKFFGAGYYELVPVSQNYKVQPTDAIIRVR